MVNFRSFRGHDCDPDHYLVVAKVRQRLTVSKRAGQMFDMDRFNLQNLNDVAVKEQYQVNISNTFTSLEILDDDDDDDDDGDINRAWKSVREYMKASPTESLGYVS
jgi:hypothetical protein